MKLAILGDTHLGFRNGDLAFHSYFEKFYDYFFDFLKKENIKTVIQTGDLFDNRRFINLNSLFLSKKYLFDRLKEQDITLHTPLGNHDIFHKSTLSVNSPSLLFGNYSNINIYNSFNTVAFDGLNIDFVPWICQENHDEIVEAIKTSGSKINVGHWELNNFAMYRGIPHLNGEFDAKFLSKYDLTISGHFHHKSYHDKVYYVGTPYQLTWADYEDERGFHIFDTETLSMTFFENPFRIFQHIVYDDSTQNIEYWNKFDFSILKDSLVRLFVLNKSNPYIFDTVLDKIQKIGVIKMNIVEDFIDKISDDALETTDTSNSQDTIDILNNFIDDFDSSVDKNYFKILMREIYVDALNSGVSD